MNFIKTAMVSVALASSMSANTMTDVIDTAPTKVDNQNFVVLEANKNYKVTNANGYWSYTSAATPAYKYQIEGNNANTVLSQVTLTTKESNLVINGTVKVQGATMTWDLAQGGSLTIKGAPTGNEYWGNVALAGHFGKNLMTLDNGATLKIEKDVLAIGGGFNKFTLNNSTLEIVGQLRGDGNGVQTNIINATNSNVLLGGIHSRGKWNGQDGASADIRVTGGTFKVSGNIYHVFDWKQGTGDDLGNFGNNIVLDGSTNTITGYVNTDGAYGGQNYITVKNGGSLTIGGSVYTDLLYNITSGANVNELTDDKTRGRMKSLNRIIMEGENSNLSIGGDLRLTGGDVVFVKNHISMSGTGVITIAGDVTVQAKDGSTGRKTTWEGENQNIIDAPLASVSIGKSASTLGNVFGVIKTLNTGNRFNVKDLSIGVSLVARENDSSNQIKINGGKLEIKDEIRAFAKVGNGATGAANYIELTDGSNMTVGGLVFADNFVVGANAVNKFKASKSNLTFNGDIRSHQGGRNDFTLVGSNLTLNGAESAISELRMDADSVVSYKGNLVIENSNSTGGMFIANGENVSGNTLTINNSNTMTTYNIAVLSNVKNGDLVAKTKNTRLETAESDDGLLTTKLMLKEVTDSQGVTMWIADNVAPILSKSAYNPNKDIVVSTNTLYLANMNSLNKRMGELRSIPNAHGAWGRVFGGEQTNKFSDTTMMFVSAQAGYDYSVSVGENKSLYVGTAFSYGYGSSNFGSSYVGTSTSGIAYNLSNESLTQQLIEGALYLSYIENSGWYNDTILKVGGLFNSMNSNSLNLDNSSFVVTLSDEFGYRFTLGEKKNWFIDPQAEVTFGYTQGGEFSRTNGISSLVINYDGTTILRERLGATFGYKAVDDTTLKVDVYAGVFGEFDQYIGGTMNAKTEFATAKGSVDSSMTSDIRGVVNYGVNVKLDKGVSIYGDMEHSFGGKLSTTYKINAGVRYSFGDAKKLVVEEKPEAPVKLKEEKSETKGETEAKGDKGSKKGDKGDKAKTEKKETKTSKKSSSKKVVSK